jgi:multicomponent Na+:H+ antiporter subunit E
VNIFLLNVLLTFAWAALLGEFTSTNLLAGFGLGYLMIWLMQSAVGTGNYFSKGNDIVRFIGTFVWELIKSNFRVAYSVFQPAGIEPGLVAVPLDLKTDLGIMVLANLITLTPGTLSIDVSDDNRVLYVHTMYADTPEAVRREIKEVFEARVREVFES